MLSPDGVFEVPSEYAHYGKYIEKLNLDDFLKFYRDMARIRRFDNECTALQRQGQMGLWVPAVGQEAAQIGSGYAVGKNDHMFPSYREHGVAITHGIDLMSIIKMMRGVNHGGWNPEETRFHLYAIVLGTQVLHAAGYAMGVNFDGNVGTGDPEVDQAVITYFGDGATAEGDVSEALLFAAVNKSPLVFFCQNNQWAISSPVSAQTVVPLYLRGEGFGVPGIQVDGNDVLACYAVTAKHMDDARNGLGPSLISTALRKKPITGLPVTQSRASRSSCAARASGTISSKKLLKLETIWRPKFVRLLLLCLTHHLRISSSMSIPIPTR
jgi:pyruvate dehydrogenase E1 component alpha subunit